MGCVASSTASSQAGEHDVSNWINVTLETETGDFVVKAADGSETRTKFTLERVPETSKVKRNHFVEQKIGGTWDDVGGKVKFSCVDQPSMEKLWGEVDIGVSSNSLKGPSKTPWDLACNGVAECKGGDKTFLMTGAINEAINIVEKESGEVVLTLKQSHGGSDLKFYDCLVGKTGIRTSQTPAEKEIVQNAFCGRRNSAGPDGDRYITLQLKPEILERIPISLFAMATMYSNFGLNDLDC